MSAPATADRKLRYRPLKPSEDPRTPHTYREVADFLGVCDSQVSKLVKGKKMRAVSIGLGEQPGKRIMTGEVLAHMGLLPKDWDQAPARLWLVKGEKG